MTTTQHSQPVRDVIIIGGGAAGLNAAQLVVATGVQGEALDTFAAVGIPVVDTPVVACGPTSTVLKPLA